MRESARPCFAIKGRNMGCLYLLLALISPRLLLAGLWIFSDYVRPNAFEGWILPLLGLIFMPYLTLALTWALNTEFGFFQIAAVVIGVLLDLGSSSDAERRRRQHARG
jgi:hypothetical protein